MGQTPDDGPSCVAEERAEVEARLNRCNNLQLIATTVSRGERSFEAIRDGLNENGLQDRAVVKLNALRVEGRCEVGVSFPLRFNEYSALRFDISEKAAMPYRIERTKLP